MSQNASKIAVVYYSRSGHSRQVAEQLSVGLDADIFRIDVQHYKTPVLGYLRAGYQSLRGVRPVLDDPAPDVSAYDVVIVGGPIWTSYPAAPVRSFLERIKSSPAVMGLFLTSGDHSPPEKAYAVAAQDAEHAFVATLSIPNGIEGTPEAAARIDHFVADILGGLSRHNVERLR